MLKYVEDISFNGNFGVLVGLHHGGYATGPRYTSDAGITWSKGSTVAGDLRQFPKSVFADFDGTNYRSIIVGEFQRVSSGNQITQPMGYIQIDSLDIIETNTAKLNYVTMKNDKFLIVGDSGVVLLGQRSVNNLQDAKQVPLSSTVLFLVFALLVIAKGIHIYFLKL
jgi:hypothetical protein